MDPESGKLKICDFGLSRFGSTLNTLTCTTTITGGQLVGSKMFLAPEIIVPDEDKKPVYCLLVASDFTPRFNAIEVTQK